MTTFVVTYPAQDGARFDADYYIATHVPLVREKWAQYGMIAITEHIADEPEPAYLMIAVLEFGSGAALDSALGSPEAADVFGDVPNFTSIAPVAVRCEAR